jgi:hypothetical protein
MTRFTKSLPLVLACLLSVGAVSARESKTVPALVISQNCKMVGNVSVLISKEGLKCHCESKNITFLSRPPFNEVLVYSQETKTIYRARGSGLMVPFFAQVIAVTGFCFSDAEMVPAGMATIAGHKCRYYRSTARYDYKLRDRLKHGEIASRSAISLRFYYIDDLTFDKRYGDFMATLFSLPVSHGLPARVTFIRPEGGEGTYLETSRLSPTIMDLTELDVPKGLKTVATMQEILTGHGNDSGLDFFR